MNIRRLGAASLGHFSIDFLNASVAIILTAMAGRFELVNSQIAFGVMLYVFASALTQPLFGLLADRLRGRWLASIGLLWTMTFFAVAAYANTYTTMLTLLIIGALGSAAFHPVGTMSATNAGGNRATSAASIFFLFGQSGFAIGPMVAGFVLESWGMAGIPYLSLATIPAFLLMAIYLRKPIEEAPAVQLARPAIGQRKESMIGGMALLAFIGLIALKSTTGQTFMALLPKYLSDLGYTPAQYGQMLGIYILAGAAGTLAGGFLGDRYSRRLVVFWALLLGAPSGFFMLTAAGTNFVVLAIFSGFMLSLPHSIIVVMAQRLLPKRQGLASGAVLGFMFASGAAASGVVGWISDYTGLQAALQVVALLPILAGICALSLPATRTPKVELLPEPAPATGD